MGRDDPELEALVRAKKLSRRLPADAMCAGCRTIEHLSVGQDGAIFCYSCLVRRLGHRPFEADHIAGEQNWGGLTLRLRPNDHRRATELRLSLGIDRWPDADGDPLIVLAHFLGGLATILLLLAEWLLEFAMELADRLGDDLLVAAADAPIVQ